MSFQAAVHSSSVVSLLASAYSLAQRLPSRTKMNGLAAQYASTKRLARKHRFVIEQEAELIQFLRGDNVYGQDFLERVPLRRKPVSHSIPSYGDPTI
jgi:hypothetical protein